jgi:hypothetical protein
MCSSTDVISSPRCLDHFSNRRSVLALMRQPPFQRYAGCYTCVEVASN